MVEKTYNHKEIESRWQKKWATDNLYTTPNRVEGKDNFYILSEFAYPSGNLHVGHWYAFSVPDIFARLKRMQGYNVLYPVGFDSFGLPAENAAIKRGLDPREWTYSNIEYMTNQLRSMGASFDWSRCIKTSDPEYYQWTQYIFTKFFERGLAYQDKAMVNWCPKCQTVLANEQVISGKCERCDTPVERREMNQWMLKITDYAEQLLDDLDTLDWPEEIKAAQRNWIGKSEGSTFKFEIRNSKFEIEVFTTRPDTLFGVTYVVLAPENPLVAKLLENQDSGITNQEEIEGYIKRTQGKSELERQENKEKTGVELQGIKAIHPATGEELPIWIADYVLGSYGTGAVMAVPAHDERDWEFAQKYSLPVKWVIEAEGTEVNPEKGSLINSEEFNTFSSEEAVEKITATYGQKKTTYRLRDWSVGRQRYWGCPIPVVYDPDGKPHSVSQEHLPWILPTDVDHTPTGEPPLARSTELKKRTEEVFGKGWTPEVETLDTFVDSSWYYLRYLDPHNNEELASESTQQVWMPIDLYSGGAEHTTMHLLYARFFYKAMGDVGLISNGREPFKKRMNRSLILGPDGAKMSKSKGNVIDPDEQVKHVGADAVRIYLAFLGPYNEVSSYPWDMGGIAGVRRFLEKVWRQQDYLRPESNEKIERVLHKTIKKVGEEIESLKLNTAVSALMEFTNAIEKEKSVSRDQYERLLIILAPFAPHLTEEIWSLIGNKYSIHNELWPKYDSSMVVENIVNLPIQINGKVRATIHVAVDAAQGDVVSQAQGLEVVQKWLKNAKISQIIYIPGRILNIVVD